MIRKQVYIEPEQEEKLKRIAKALRVTEAELIRRGIEELPELAAPESREEAVRDLLCMMEERAARLPKGGGTTRWRREDLYIR
ncbi:MAG TPA: ribbon-helix-helix domain-containing protein [Dehalococcoidia bacterium]